MYWLRGFIMFFFFSSRRRHTRSDRDWSSDVCSSDLGLFERRTVPLDSIMRVVGSRRYQDEADDIAVRALTLVRDVGGRLHALRAHRRRLALVTYADEANGGVGQTLAQVLRQGGDTVEY